MNKVRSSGRSLPVKRVAMLFALAGGLGLAVASPHATYAKNPPACTGPDTLQVKGSPPTNTTPNEGVPYAFTVTAVDCNGNTDTGYKGMVTFSSSDLAASLPSSYTFKGGDKGIQGFSATFNTTGSQNLTTTDTSNSLITGKLAVTVNSAANPGGTGGAGPNGNGGQGTIKLEVGGQDFEVDGNDNNEPKAPCVNGKITFNVIGDGLAANTSVNVTAEVQGGSSSKTQVYNTSVTTNGSGSFTILNISLDAGQNYKIEVIGTNGDNTPVDKQKVIHSGVCTTSPPGSVGGPTPELGSGELLATGLLPIGAILLYRRRRNRRAS